MRWSVRLNTLRTETERLVLRLIEEDDYSSWLTEYENRLPSQHKYDEAFVRKNGLLI